MNKQKIIQKSVILLILIAIVLGIYFYYKWSLSKQEPQAVIQKETAQLLAKVSKLMLLPVGEEPTIATVSDPEALKDQLFFAKAQKGDKVLIYTQAKKAILYSVSLNRIIDVSTLSINPQKSSNITQTTTPVITPDTQTPKKQ
jgi:hypothetical protein